MRYNKKDTVIIPCPNCGCVKDNYICGSVKVSNGKQKGLRTRKRARCGCCGRTYYND